MRTGIAVVVSAMALGVLAALAPPPPAEATQVKTLPPPTVSASTLTLPSRDSVGVVVAWSRACAGTACPTAFDLSVIKRFTTNQASQDVAFRRVRAYRDTVRLERSYCAVSSPTSAPPDTLIVTVRGLTPTARSGPGMYKVPVRCLTMNVRERAEVAAMADSYPATPAYSRTVVSDWGHKVTVERQRIMRSEQIAVARTATDSAWITRVFDSLTVAPDSVRSPDNSLATLRIGYRYTMCELRRNRYTGVVGVITRGDPALCERVRLALQSERSG